MFERGKKEDEYNEGTGRTASEPRQGYDLGTPRSSNSGGGGGAVIGRSIQINGDLRGNEDLRIEGDVSGTVELKNSNLTIGKEGKVRADVYAKSIAVDGTTEGDLYASERVIVHINAQVRGNITAPKVGIEEGARFKGSIEMDPKAVDKALGKLNMQGGDKPVTDVSSGKPADKSTNKNGAKDTGSRSAAGAA